MTFRFHVLGPALCGALLCGAAWAQPAPGVTITQPQVPGAQPQAPQTGTAASSSALPTLIPNAGDTNDVDEVVLPAKPVAILSGQSTWEDGLKNVRAALQRVRDELGKAGIAAAGRPLALFVDTSDDNFKFEAMVPIEKAPEGAPATPPDMRFGTTPSGKAYRFVHKGPYDEIDSTYETITAYLDAKDIIAKDAFVEEYANDIADPTDPNLEINIFVQPK